MRESEQIETFFAESSLPGPETTEQGASAGLDFWFLLGIYIVEMLCGAIFAVYRMATYAHSKDTPFGQSCCARASITIGIFAWVLPILWVPMDVLLSQRNDLARDINDWALNGIQMYQLFYLWLMAPIMLAFYETEAAESFCQRTWHAIKIQLPLFLFLIIATVPTYFFLNEVKLDETNCLYTHREPNTTIDGEQYYVGASSFPLHLYIVTVWIGLLMTSIFGGIGVIFLPYNLLNDWIFRPKPIKKADFGKRQKILLPKLLNLRREGKHLENERM